MRDRVATGKRLWRTCESQVEAFTPDGTIAVGGPTYGDGYSPLEVAWDAQNGLVRQWTRALFLETVVEDDQHFLVIADNGAPRPAASSAAASPPAPARSPSRSPAGRSS